MNAAGEDGADDSMPLDNDGVTMRSDATVKSTNDGELKLGNKDEVMLMSKGVINDRYLGDVLMEGDELASDENANTNQTKSAPVLRKYRLMQQKQRLKHLMELKVRLDLLNEVWTSSASETVFVKDEKQISSLLCSISSLQMQSRIAVY